ncbi:MAG: 3-dehydroquinate synthase [Chloroflexota bacterium]
MTNQLSNKNVIITGFMGTGKTTIGRQLARRLKRQFIDMDDEIERYFDKTIPEVFADDGEEVFRAYESQLCADLAQETDLVISTGGGALVNPQNREVMAETGVLICLTASPKEILRRVLKREYRPLLPGDQDEKRRNIERLLAERRLAYGAIPYQIDTTEQKFGQIIGRLLDILYANEEVPGMVRLPVQTPTGFYQICLGEGTLNHVGKLLYNRNLRPGPVAIVTNPVIAEQYTDTLQANLREAGYEPTICMIPEGEQHKTLANISPLYTEFLAAGMDRKSAVIALGGGVVGDMTGFAAATYLRGVPFVQIPTSLLSMVDASVGGKTGVDLPQGKNLVGAFKQPEVVIIDPKVMETLPAAEFRSGLAEVIKHGIIDDPNLFEVLEREGPANMTRLLADAIQVKINVVEEDPFEQGRRATLNLGHTFGHAIELVSEFSMRHGEAIAVGLVAAARMAADIGRCAPELADRITRVVEHLALPTHVSSAEFDVEQVMAAMAHDKKRAGKILRFIIPQDLGDVVIIDNPGDEYVRRALEAVIK